MYKWFECKVSYERAGEEGKQTKVKESYLVDALSFTEAESRIIEEMRPFASGEFNVTDIRRARFYETFLDENGDRYYKAKVNMITFDEKSDKEKKTAKQMLVQASSIQGAIDALDKGMKETLADYEIAAMAETPIVSVFPYGVKEDKPDKHPV